MIYSHFSEINNYKHNDTLFLFLLSDCETLWHTLDENLLAKLSKSLSTLQQGVQNAWVARKPMLWITEQLKLVPFLMKP